MRNHTSEIPARLPKLVLTAAIVTLLYGVLQLIGTYGQLLNLPGALIALTAGIGILRRHIWSAYGYALLQLTQLVILLGIRSSVSGAVLAVTAIFTLGLSALLFFAGKALAAHGGERGSAWPWIALACLFTFPLLFVRCFRITTGAMEDTLLIGDGVAVRVFPKIHPARGDLVALRYPIDRKQIFLKRIVGVPGDHLKIINRVVYRNGAALHEPYATHKVEFSDSFRDNFPSTAPGRRGSDIDRDVALRDMLQHHVVNGEVVVPPGRYFVLGDNRDNSLDSRSWGFLPESDVVGRLFLIYDSETVPSEGYRDAKDFFLRRQRRWHRIFTPL